METRERRNDRQLDQDTQCCTVRLAWCRRWARGEQMNDGILIVALVSMRSVA